MGGEDKTAEDALANLEVSFSRGEPDVDPKDQEGPRVRKRRSDAGQPRKPRQSGNITQAKLVEELLIPWASAAALAAPACPTVATVMAAEGEETIKAFVSLAAQYPKFYAGLQKAAQIGPAARVAQTAMTLLIALMLDTRRISPEHPVAGVTGLAALTRQTHPEWYDGSPPPGPPLFHMPPPPPPAAAFRQAG
jgi:hypothetical protein